MRYSSLIDNKTSKEWGLTLQEAYLFEWMYSLPSWANRVIIENDVFYFASKGKAVDELPLLTDKVDTMYRYYKNLESKGLILITKIKGKDYISITEKAKSWNGNKPFNSDLNPTLGNKSEHSENNPSKLGFKSECNSEINPTYNNISNNNINNNTSNISICENSKNEFSPSKQIEVDSNFSLNKNLLKEKKEKTQKTKSSAADEPKIYDPKNYVDGSGDGELRDLVGVFYKKNPDKYKPEMYKEFLAYWTELPINSKNKKERWRHQKFFNVSGRLATWAGNLKKEYAPKQYAPTKDLIHQRIQEADDYGDFK
jgi:hypothetical protein